MTIINVGLPASKEQVRELKQGARENQKMTQQITPYQEKLKTLQGYFASLKARFDAVLPTTLNHTRFREMAMAAWRGAPELAECDPLSFMGAIMECAQLGLVPGRRMGYAHILPFKNKKMGRTDAQLIIGYQGLVKLMRDSGLVRDVRAEVVHKNDNFVYSYGTNPILEHAPTLDEPGEAIATYMIAYMTDGTTHFRVLPWSHILKVRERAMKKNYTRVEIKDGREVAIRTSADGKDYETETPWVSDLEEMARKTALKNEAKYLPLGDQYQRAASVDNAAEVGEDQNLRDVVVDAELVEAAPEADVPKASVKLPPNPYGAGIQDASNRHHPQYGGVVLLAKSETDTENTTLKTGTGPVAIPEGKETYGGYIHSEPPPREPGDEVDQGQLPLESSKKEKAKGKKE